MVTPQFSDEPESKLFYGTVIAVQANFYQVLLDSVQESLLCTRPTRLKKIGQSVLVGDRVIVKSRELDRGAIAEVLPRKTILERPPIANAQQILLVFALEEPTLDPVQLSRFLVKAESTNLKLLLGLNKADLITFSEKEIWQTRLKNWGYEGYFFSVNTGEGITELKNILRDKITILAGPSGVGKSSLASLLIPELDFRIGAVSGKLQKGRHTTRHVALFELPQGGFIADSPGFNQPTFDFPSESLIQFFPEARARLTENTCKFHNCIHKDEPDCAVKGEWERYQYYLKFLEEAIAYSEKIAHKREEESTLKTKVKTLGKKIDEPKLEAKKYRRISRKVSNQKLEDLYTSQSLNSLDDELDFDG
ncbi:ribosome small subunit-stimulated GTPase EngC [Geminocystis sp. NIES-3708]|uniref:small ribosomal subunit biogenesis GTPase RsgA n=1 Tax=Geminocystis sp. NIES-3708 TaxID=1615909 RepID=UPI0005FC91B1|nr:small ribosomal subunit biogenesis GTPase RsgA [Geminocystis sp. NIES-3708]BAQ63060.1 ribosome small subunit-stimulated GTPase EngC [Geminocystis sp. NIES-3708]